jgi:thioredoxin 1
LPIAVTRDTFETEVLQAKGPVLVDFWGPQCRPCLALMPAVERFEQTYGGKLKITKVNAAENRMLCAKLKVFGLPTFLFYREGVEVDRLTGDQITAADLTKAVEKILASDG